jgi:hypothetical protein
LLNLDAPAEPQKEPGFTSLFNGKDLSGWEGDKKAWAVVDGAIQSTGGNTKRNWLIWRGGELRDFELRLSFKFTKGNSGVQVRSKEIAKWQVRGYQVEIADATKMGLWHHAQAPENIAVISPPPGNSPALTPMAKRQSSSGPRPPRSSRFAGTTNGTSWW